MINGWPSITRRKLKPCGPPPALNAPRRVVDGGRGQGARAGRGGAGVHAPWGHRFVFSARRRRTTGRRAELANVDWQHLGVDSEWSRLRIFNADGHFQVNGHFGDVGPRGAGRSTATGRSCGHPSIVRRWRRRGCAATRRRRGRQSRHLLVVEPADAHFCKFPTLFFPVLFPAFQKVVASWYIQKLPFCERVALQVEVRQTC